MLFQHEDPTEFLPFFFVKTYFMTSLNTTLLLWFTVVNILSFVHAALLLSFMEYFHSGDKDDPTLPYLFDSLNMVIGVLYYAVLSETDLTGSSEIDTFLAILQEIHNIALKTDTKTRELLVYVIVIVDHVFRPERWRIGLDELVPDGLPKRGTPYERLDHVILYLSKDSRESIVEGVRQRVAYHERQKTIKSPTFKTRYGMAVLSLWFGLWIPIRLWMSPLGFWGTLVIYPVIIYVFSAPLLYKTWVGTAWSYTRPWRNVPHEFWPVQYINRILAMDDKEHIGHISVDAA